MLVPVFVRLNVFLLLLRYHTIKKWIYIKNCLLGKKKKLITCNKFEFNGKFFEWAELTPLDADDSLDNNDTVSLNAESLSGLSVLGSRNGPSEPLPVPLSDDVDIDDIVELVTADMVEFERLCVRPRRISLFFCSNKLSSPRIASSSASCVSSKLAIEKRYELVRSDDV